MQDLHNREGNGLRVILLATYTNTNTKTLAICLILFAEWLFTCWRYTTCQRLWYPKYLDEYRFLHL